jgi:hypothetical protein
MQKMIKLWILLLDILVNRARMYVPRVPEARELSGVDAKSAVVIVCTIGNEPPDDEIPESLSNSVRKWHGGMTDRYENIGNLTDTLMEHRSVWPVPNDIVTWLTTNLTELDRLMKVCGTRNASANDRADRASLVRRMTYYCLDTVRNWVFGEYAQKTLTRKDVHSLGFLLMGESAKGHHRTGDSMALAEVKVRVNDVNNIYVVIDQSSNENAALVKEGWPEGVHNAVLIIETPEGVEVLRKLTTRLHNEIKMPEGSRGKQFVIRASFLKHVDDELHFGNETTFTMPKLIKDIHADEEE